MREKCTLTTSLHEQDNGLIQPPNKTMPYGLTRHGHFRDEFNQTKMQLGPNPDQASNAVRTRDLVCPPFPRAEIPPHPQFLPTTVKT